MYLHAGNNKIIRTRNVIGIFDMDNATQGADTREFLRRAEKEGKVELSKAEIPKSFVLYARTNQKTKQKKEKRRYKTPRFAFRNYPHCRWQAAPKSGLTDRFFEKGM